MAALCCSVFLLFGPCFILQAVGFCSPYWVTMDSCDAVGLFYRCCTQNSTGCDLNGKDTYLNRTVLGLQATSLSVLLLCVISMGCIILCSKEQDDDLGCCGYIFLCSIVLYPIAGILSIVGCIVLAVDYTTYHLRWGFFLCVSAGCYMLLVVIIICYFLRSESGEDNSQDQISQYREDYNRQEPISQYEDEDNRQEQIWTVQAVQTPQTSYAHAEVLEAHKTVDPITQQVSYTIRMLRFIGIVQHHNDN